MGVFPVQKNKKRKTLSNELEPAEKNPLLALSLSVCLLALHVVVAPQKDSSLTHTPPPFVGRKLAEQEEAEWVPQQQRAAPP